jgi:hypothetical protein
MKFPPPSKEYLARRAAEEAKTAVFPRKVTAVDERGGTYEKTVKVLEKNDKDKAVLSFGGFCEYRLNGRYGIADRVGPLCIDGQGMNHRGVSGVTVSAEDMAEILAWARKESR